MCVSSRALAVFTQKCKNLQLVRRVNEWIDIEERMETVSSLKSELRVAVVREIYGRKFIYNFS